MTLRQSPLAAHHRALDAQMVDFGGWEMPIAYPTGTIAEHMACRSTAAAFDVSHLGSMRVEGDGAFERLQATLTNDLDEDRTRVAPSTRTSSTPTTHRCSTTSSCGGTRAAMANPTCSTSCRTPRTPTGSSPHSAGSTRPHTRAVIAVQGPEARTLIEPVFPDAAAVGRFRVAHCSWNGTDCVVAGTGYTGEPGLEIAVPVDAAGALWDAMLAVGVAPAGLGARDTLRLEAGLPLHGHELGPGITSLQAGLGWVVAWNKPDFVGRDAALAERDRGVARRLVGIATDGRRPARAGCAVLVDDTPIGEVTSGNFSPVLGHGIAMAFVEPELESGANVVVDVRGKSLPGTSSTCRSLAG